MVTTAPAAATEFSPTVTPLTIVAPLANHPILSSMCFVGRCADNAAADEFFGTIKRGSVCRKHF